MIGVAVESLEHPILHGEDSRAGDGVTVAAGTMVKGAVH